MKLPEQKLDVELIGGSAPKQFQVAITAHLFKVLSDLYPNKPRAIIRELCCNAVDSHNAAGKNTVPIRVHLPSSLEPYFSVTDEGVGMSPQTVDEVLTHYGKSTKQHTNDETGCLGLGAKSPFCYAEQFTLISTKDGVTTTYTAYLDAKGVPNYTIVGSVKTGKPNGSTFTVPVKTADVSSWVTTAADVLGVFEVRPVVEGNTVKWEDRKILLEDDITSCKYKFYTDRTGSSYGAMVRVVMGNIAYPVDRYAAKLQPREASVCSHALDVFVPIGTVEFVPSREGLSYTPHTCAALQRILADACNDAVKKLSKSVEDAPSIFEARIAVNKLNSGLASQLGLGNTGSYKWKGKDVSDRVYRNVYKDVAFETFTKRSYATAGNKDFGYSHGSTFCIDVSRSMLVFVGDLDVGNYVRVSYYLDQNKIDAVSSYRYRGHADQKFVYLLTGDAAEVDKVVKDLGIESQIIKTSALAKPPSQPRKPASKNPLIKAKIMKLDNGMWVDDASPPDKGVYVILDAYETDIGTGTLSSGSLNTLVADLNEISDTKLVIHGVRPSKESVLTATPGKWQKLKDLVPVIIEKAKKKYSAQLVANNILSSCTRHWHKFPTNLVTTCKIEKTNSPADRLVKFISKTAAKTNDKTVEKKVSTLVKLMSLFNVSSKTVVAADITTQMTTLIDDFKKEYPLFDELSYYYSTQVKSAALCDYVNGVDLLKHKRAKTKTLIAP